MKALIERYKHAWILLYFPVYLIWFSYLEKKVTRNFHVVHVPLDDCIPFVEFFIVPYLLWFVYVAVGVIYFFFKNTSDYYKLCRFLFIGMTIFLLISTVYPNGHYLRPGIFPRENVFTSVVQWLYHTDTPTNLFPSIHVYNSLGVHIAVMNNKDLREKKWVQIGSGILVTSIILSTVFLKQHSVFDVLTGFLMAGINYKVVYGRQLRQEHNKNAEEALQKS